MYGMLRATSRLLLQAAAAALKAVAQEGGSGIPGSKVGRWGKGSATEPVRLRRRRRRRRKQSVTFFH